MCGPDPKQYHVYTRECIHASRHGPCTRDCPTRGADGASRWTPPHSCAVSPSPAMTGADARGDAGARGAARKKSRSGTTVDSHVKKDGPHQLSTCAGGEWWVSLGEAAELKRVTVSTRPT